MQGRWPFGSLDSRILHRISDRGQLNREVKAAQHACSHRLHSSERNQVSDLNNAPLAVVEPVHDAPRCIWEPLNN